MRSFVGAELMRNCAPRFHSNLLCCWKDLKKEKVWMDLMTFSEMPEAAWHEELQMKPQTASQRII